MNRCGESIYTITLSNCFFKYRIDGLTTASSRPKHVVVLKGHIVVLLGVSKSLSLNIKS
jgi:hypothetical protein